MPYIESGYKWPSPNISVSFPPAGAMVQGTPNVLPTIYDAKYPRAVWQGEILRALQSWQDCCAVTFTLVSDDGSPDNIIASQGDPRFGDIRIWGYVGLTGMTRQVVHKVGMGHGTFPGNGASIAGDLWINGNAVFNIGSVPDLYSLVLHEFGACIGSPEGQPDPSVMNGPGPYYSGLYPNDKEWAVAVYGPPPSPDNRPRIWTAPSPPPPAPPPAPGQLPAPSGLASAPSWALLLTWQAVAGTQVYVVERAVSNGPFKVVAHVYSPYYSDGQMGQNHPHAIYRITAIDVSGKFGLPAEISL